MAHARASASAADRWLACPGSIQMSKDIPEQDSKYSVEGTEAHAEGSEALEDGIDPKTEAVRIYTDYIRSMSTDSQRHVEVDLTPALSKLDPDLGGTADTIMWFSKVLEVVDYKHGAGIYVGEIDNTQMKVYALGALLTVGDSNIRTVRMTIVQPRIEYAEPIRTYEFPAIELLDFAEDLVQGAMRTRIKPPILVTGEHCNFCPARAQCPAVNRLRTELMAQEYTPHTDVALIAQGLDMIPALQGQIKALRELAYSLAIQGVKVPGHKLVAKRATRKWKDADTVAASAGPSWFEHKLMSPPKIEAMMGKASFAAQCADLVEKKSSGWTLAADSDARPPVSGLLTNEDFTVIDGTAETISNPPSNAIWDQQ